VNNSETRSIVQIWNDDTLCCVKSIIICLAYNHIETQIHRYNLTVEDIEKTTIKDKKKIIPT